MDSDLSPMAILLRGNTRPMRITTKGQVTIPQRFRLKFGLLPHTDVHFEEADGGVTIRPIVSKRALVTNRLRKARGVAVRGAGTDDVMRLTRGED
jgi:AbrB family looped-hinge helix DNA binding protein